MPRQAVPKAPPLPTNTLIVDNGAYSIKAGFASTSPQLDRDCQVIPNCIARSRDKRLWAGAQLERCQDYGEMMFRRPVEKGYLVGWEAEKEIWDVSFFDKNAKLKCDPQDTSLILTEAPNTPSSLQTNCDQMVFEEFEFASYYRCIGPSLNAYNNVPAMFGDHSKQVSDVAAPVETLLVVDSGYSHTTITPILQGQPLQSAIRRLDIGGKVLTNYLKELVSIRHYNMMDETHLMNEVKEAVSFVSSDFRGDLEKTWKGNRTAQLAQGNVGGGVVVDYVLPDYNTHKKGIVRQYDPSLAAKVRKLGSTGEDAVEDFMTLGNERFAVPELLFSPGDVGMKEAGLAETMMQSLYAIPGALWPSMLANVIAVGGNVLIPGFVERLEADIRQLTPAECPVRVARAPDPVKSTWMGGAKLGSDREALKGLVVTRQEYQENGASWLLRRWSGG
ncbi:MAG: Actin- protein 6 [Caeruleum heppii]|nr:MAG: Actin- protein 6 [Caeruleum heppii]